MSNLEKFNKAIYDALNVKDIVTINDEMGPDEIENWDSLGHIDLVTALEEQFGINIDVIDISRMYTIGDIKKTLKKYGVVI
jgi:acyl carrier protein